jgi:demethylmenaquinone methyltransferase / 2-methoxy-6-polyprenyl-1,4-benzoquinol methylase
VVDVANAVLSFGQDQHWRRVAARAVDPRPGELLLDVATGTGRLARELQDAGARVVALDFSQRMLAAGAAKEAEVLPASGPLAWCAGDGLQLPFADATFDGASISFGLRNLPDTEAGLRELARVVRPGGRLVVLEFSTPAWAPFRHVYERWLVAALPRIAEVVSSDASAYRYLAESILAWPDQAGLARTIAASGWARPRWQDLSGGIVALHHAVRP